MPTGSKTFQYSHIMVNNKLYIIFTLDHYNENNTWHHNAVDVCGTIFGVERRTTRMPHKIYDIIMFK